MNVLITGGATGVGGAITRLLAAVPGNKVYFTFYQSDEKARALETEFENVQAIKCNFMDELSMQSLLGKMDDLTIDLLVNNAFTGLETNYFHKTDPEYFSDNFKRNIIPVIKITQKAILQFRKKKAGKIITILSSYIINKPPMGLSEYVATKNYLLSLSKSWAVENARFNITANCISPSFMQTDLTAGTDERIVETMVENHPLKKLLDPKEVAEAVFYFANASQQINGTNLVMNAASDIS